MAKSKKRVARHSKRKAVKRKGPARKRAGSSGPKKAKAMPRSEMKKFRDLLIKIRKEVGGDLSHLTDSTLNKSARDASGDLSGYSYHMADMASDDYERDFTLGRATDEQKRLYSIDEAMKRIEDGSYGLCMQCSKAISKKRLAALPDSELCIDCQKKNEVK
jgi:RNA polymerase-binding protein DksA